MRSTAAALAATMTLSGLALSAQGARPAQPVPATAAAAVVFELANSMGMLRGMQQEDSILTLEHWATGTMTVGQQRFEITDYRSSINFAVPGRRVDFTVKGPDGAARRTIEVVSGTAAWNEADRGRQATPAPNETKQRLVALWTTPMGVVKAARMAGANAKVTTTGGATVLSFPLPAPAGDVMVHATVRRDASLLTAPHGSALKDLVGTYLTTVQTTGAVVSETRYSEYGDWNWDDYKSDVMLPRRAVRTSGDRTFELTTKNTNTYNPYVVMPVPDNVR